MKKELKKDKIAIYPGSFDPITFGHIDILSSGAKIFDKVIIAVLNNSSKKSLLSVTERIELIKKSVKSFDNVEVDSFDGLTVDFAKNKGAEILLRGVRNTSDFEYEMLLAQNNQTLNENIKTVFLTPQPEHIFISSSAVKEIYLNNGDISKFVPKEVEIYLKSLKKQFD